LRRQKGLWDIGKRLLPDTAKAFFTDLFLQPLPEPDWDEQSLSWAVEQVREDARKTLIYADKPSDFWQFPGGYAE
jgi:hypothetical protein